MGANVRLTPEERAQLLDIQDRLIELFVDREETVAAGNASRARSLQHEIDELMEQRENISHWAKAGMN